MLDAAQTVAPTAIPTAATDHVGSRRTNLALVLARLRDHGPRSRATLATELGLTRGAVSSLVADLAERGLVLRGELERGGVGRPGTSLRLDGSRVAGLGAEVNVGRLAVLAVDLAGRVVSRHLLDLDVRGLGPDGPAVALDRLLDLLDLAHADLDRLGIEPVGLTVGVAGLVDRERQVLTHAPNLGWRDVPVGDLLRGALAERRPGRTPYPVEVDNEGNLAAIAEVTPGDPERRDLLVLFGEVGIGGGIVADGRLLRGRHGWAGELGHMVVEPQGRRCGCGRIGCWETVTGLRALLDLAADHDDPLHDPRRPLGVRLEEISRRADLGDTRTLAALDQVGRWVGTGAALLVNVLDPATVVLSGYLAAVGPHLLPAVQAALVDGVLAADGGGTRVELSSLGDDASTLGGAAVSLEPVLADPTRVAHRLVTAGATS